MAQVAAPVGGRAASQSGRTRTCHFMALVDDHSRFLLGIRAVPTKEVVWALSLLEEAIELCGVPHEIMSGHGTAFVAIVWTFLSRFQRSLEEVRIRHIRTQVDTPRTNGKVEAFWATLQGEVLDRQQLADLAAAEAAVTAYAVAATTTASRRARRADAGRAVRRNVIHDRGFRSVPALAGVANLLHKLMVAYDQSHLHREISPKRRSSSTDGPLPASAMGSQCRRRRLARHLPLSTPLNLPGMSSRPDMSSRQAGVP